MRIPSALYIETTNLCNARCVFCYYPKVHGTMPVKYMDMDLFKKIVDEFVKLFVEAVDAMKLALPWEEGVKLTPLPEPNKPAYLKELIDDAGLSRVSCLEKDDLRSRALEAAVAL